MDAEESRGDILLFDSSLTWRLIVDTCLTETTTLTDKTTHLAVGIDTARYGHYVSFMNHKRELIVSDLPIAESADGYEKLKKQLEKLNRKFAHVHFHVHIDAAGQYATNLENFLRNLELPITVSVGEPKRNKDYHRAMSPKLKSDASESRMMARYAVAEHPSSTPALPQEFYVLREVAGRLESQVKTVTQAINRLHNLLARVFPELAVLAPNVAANWVLTLLDKYPTPQRIARGSVKSLEKIRYVDSTKATAVQAAAKKSVGSLRGEVAESLVKQAVDEVRHAQQSQQSLEKLLSEAFAALPNSGHYVPCTRGCERVEPAATWHWDTACENCCIKSLRCGRPTSRSTKIAIDVNRSTIKL
jgi:hypothetical protein